MLPTFRELKKALKRAAAKSWDGRPRAWVVDGYVVTEHFFLPVEALPSDDRALCADSRALCLAAGFISEPPDPPNITGVLNKAREIPQDAEHRFVRTELIYHPPKYKRDEMARLYRNPATGQWWAFNTVYLAGLGEPEALFAGEGHLGAVVDDEEDRARGTLTLLMPMRVPDSVQSLLTTRVESEKRAEIISAPEADV